MKKILFLLSIISFCNAHAVKQVDPEGNIVWTKTAQNMQEYLLRIVSLKNQIHNVEIQQKKSFSQSDEIYRQGLEGIVKKCNQGLEELRKKEPASYNFFKIRTNNEGYEELFVTRYKLPNISK